MASVAIEVSWDAFVELWQSPCECCGMEFAWKDAQLGSQMWISMVGSGKISAANVEQVMSGLKRWRASEDWHEKRGRYVFSVPAFLGFRRDGMPAEPRWNDRPQRKEAF